MNNFNKKEILIKSLLLSFISFSLLILSSALFSKLFSKLFSNKFFTLHFSIISCIVLFSVLFLSNLVFFIFTSSSKKSSSLEENLKLQHSILEEMKDGLLVLDPNHKIIKINKEAEQLLSLEKSENKLTGKLIDSVLKNTYLLNLLTESATKDETIEAELIKKNSKKVYLQISKTELSDSSSVLVLTDITRLKVLEKIRQDFVANVSHELKTPITSIIGFIETLQEGAIDNPSEAKRFLTIIDRQSQRLMTIIEDLLVLARIEGNENISGVDLETALVEDCLQKAVDFVERKATKKKIAIKIECPEDLSYSASWSLLEQAITNLIDNAVKYSENNCEVLIKAFKEESHLIISIKDQGHGIPKKSLDRIFERFYRVDKARSRTLGGTGLGLAIVKHVASIHGGSVEVESEPDKGSSFSILLPLRNSEGGS